MRCSMSKMLVLLTSVAVVFTACGTPDVASPRASATSAATAHRDLLPSPIQVNVLQRTTPLAAPITVSGTFGAFGGSLSIPGAGFSLTIPPLALSSRTTISVTAVAGSNVAYEMQPHGLRFLVPLTATQSLKGTNATGLLSAYFAGYFANDTDLLSNGTATITEIFALDVNLLSSTATFTIPHFSGYAVATGRCSE